MALPAAVLNEADARIPAPDRQKVLQVHLTLNCNLRCPHCYSSSAPGLRGELPLETLETVFIDAREMGFRYVAFSGGEPMLYSRLPELLTAAKNAGLGTTLTSNGTLLTPQRIDLIADKLNVLALSLDGPRDLHNTMRGSPTAFERLTASIENVRGRIPFGFICTVTARNWREIPWMAEFAVENGAQLLQLHPLEEVGRAAELLQAHSLSAEELSRVYLISEILRAQYAGSLAVQFDAHYCAEILRNPEQIYASDSFDSSWSGAESIGTLVIEADGSVVPIAYGMSKRFALGNVLSEPLGAAWARYRVEGYDGFRALCRESLEVVRGVEDCAFLNWHELIVAMSNETVEGT
jgi:MoaA/NifB/PqqE/SkfB family radical SAM enzyme